MRQVNCKCQPNMVGHVALLELSLECPCIVHALEVLLFQFLQ